MAGKHHAYIIDLDGKFLVRPSVATIGKNETFMIRNMTSFEATVENCPAFTANKTTIPAKSWAAIALAKSSGIDHFEVWITLGGYKLRVNAESDPVIIVDP